MPLDNACAPPNIGYEYQFPVFINIGTEFISSRRKSGKLTHEELVAMVTEFTQYS